MAVSILYSHKETPYRFGSLVGLPDSSRLCTRSGPRPGYDPHLDLTPVTQGYCIIQVARGAITDP